MLDLERLILSWDPSQLILTREYELGFQDALALGDTWLFILAKAMNQSPRIKLTLINGIDAILKAVDDRHTKAADKWARGWPTGQGARPTSHALCQVGPPSVGHLLMSSRVFSSWFPRRICFLV
jgi:hypothetical protein